MIGYLNLLAPSRWDTRADGPYDVVYAIDADAACVGRCRRCKGSNWLAFGEVKSVLINEPPTPQSTPHVFSSWGISSQPNAVPSQMQAVHQLGSERFAPSRDAPTDRFNCRWRFLSWERALLAFSRLTSFMSCASSMGTSTSFPLTLR